MLQDAEAEGVSVQFGISTGWVMAIVAGIRCGYVTWCGDAISGATRVAFPPPAYAIATRCPVG
eukprot:208151-Rhodomonas_salina.2